VSNVDPFRCVRRTPAFPAVFLGSAGFGLRSPHASTPAQLAHPGTRSEDSQGEVRDAEVNIQIFRL
jgi:hypothetical protein